MINQRNSRLHVVTPKWLLRRRTEVAAAYQDRSQDPQADTRLLMPASQHPLILGRYPGTEFVLRLKAAVERYRTIVSQGGKAAVFVAGNRHHDEVTGETDRVALYDAAGEWLLEHEIPADNLHGRDWTQDTPVYNGAMEIRALAKAFHDNRRFNTAEYICSPGQRSRAATYALAYGLPLTIYVPETLRIHNSEYHGPTLQRLVLNALARTVDPYGDGILQQITQGRMPVDRNIHTNGDLLSQYSHLPWYQSQTA